MPGNCSFSGPSSMVTAPNGDGVLLVGCNENKEKIYKMSWSTNGEFLEWATMKQTLKYPRELLVAMLIPDELTNCIADNRKL